MMTTPLLRFTLLATVLGLASPALAQQAPPSGDWSIQLGAGATFKPDYEGSNDYEVSPLPYLGISYKDMVFLRGPMLGANLFTWKGAAPGDALKVGPIIRYQMGRDQDKNDALNGMGDVDAGVDAGAFVSYGTGPWSLGLTLWRDVSNSYDGTTAELSGGYKYKLSDTISVRTKLSATWADENYTSAFFGVSQEQSQRSGKARYDAGGGFKDAGLSADVDYSLTKNWVLTGSLGYKHLLGDAVDSPLVKDDGSASQFSTGLMLQYRF